MAQAAAMGMSAAHSRGGGNVVAFWINRRSSLASASRKAVKPAVVRQGATPFRHASFQVSIVLSFRGSEGKARGFTLPAGRGRVLAGVFGGRVRGGFADAFRDGARRIGCAGVF